MRRGTAWVEGSGAGSEVDRTGARNQPPPKALRRWGSCTAPRTSDLWEKVDFQSGEPTSLDRTYTVNGRFH